MLLYHGSNEPIECPDVTRGTGFADLGPGFYLTDDLDAASRRAVSRARREGGKPCVSAFEFDEGAMPWITWGKSSGEEPHGVFGLRFAADRAGYEAWIGYVLACRRGNTAVEGLGEPAVVRAWIANELLEVADSGLVDAAGLAEFIEPDELIVQYCFRDQDMLDRMLHPVGAPTA